MLITISGFYELQEQLQKDAWQRESWLAAAVLSMFSKKPIKPKDLIDFDKPVAKQETPEQVEAWREGDDIKALFAKWDKEVKESGTTSD